MAWNIDRRLAWGIGIAFAGIALALAATVLPKREVHYALGVNVFHCQIRADASLCTAWASLSVGNTGNVDQDLVRVHLPAGAADWRFSARVFDIRASVAPRPIPKIRHRPEGPVIVYEITPLPENTVVDFDGQCLQCPEETIRAMAPDRIRVEATGRVAEGDPRVTTILRGLMNVLLALVPAS